MHVLMSTTDLPMTAAVVYESTDEWLVGDGGRVPNESKVPPSSGYRHISTTLLLQKTILPLTWR